MTQHAQPVTGEHPKGFRVTGRMVLFSFIGFFAVVASVNAFMITSAVRTFSGVETENAYKAGLAFNESLAAAGAEFRVNTLTTIAQQSGRVQLTGHF